MLWIEMSRHTTFKFCLDPTNEQREVLARHAGAARFAFNQCLRIVNTKLTQRKTDPHVDVPWTGFDLINAFNAWKKSEDAGAASSLSTQLVKPQLWSPDCHGAAWWFSRCLKRPLSTWLMR
jgi:hypothetical protein